MEFSKNVKVREPSKEIELASMREALKKILIWELPELAEPPLAVII